MKSDERIVWFSLVGFFGLLVDMWATFFLLLRGPSWIGVPTIITAVAFGLVFVTCLQIAIEETKK